MKEMENIRRIAAVFMAVVLSAAIPCDSLAGRVIGSKTEQVPRSETLFTVLVVKYR